MEIFDMEHYMKYFAETEHSEDGRVRHQINMENRAKHQKFITSLFDSDSEDEDEDEDEMIKGKMMTKDQYYQHLEQENLRLKEKLEKDVKLCKKQWYNCQNKIAKKNGTIHTQNFLIEALRDEIKELKEKYEEATKGRLWVDEEGNYCRIVKTAKEVEEEEEED